MDLMLKNAHLVDPQNNIDEIADLYVHDGHIAQIGKNLDNPANCADIEEVDLSGKVLVPGLVDIHVHFRDPGQEHKETIESGSRAAAHGGITAVCCMPNTTPAIDNAVGVEYVKSRAEQSAKCRVYVCGACSKNREGKILSEMGDMVAHGVVAFSDDGSGVQDSGMMRRVMDYASQFDLPVMSHCQDNGLVGEGQVNEGVVSTRLGLAGWPSEGEELQIMRDIALCRLTKCPLHIQHITTARGLQMVREAKAEGLPVTCEVTPHHLFLCEDDIGDDYNTSLKVNPPLRTYKDCEALIEGIKDKTIDCIVTDHAPHADFEKDEEFENAPFGMTGLETSVGLVVSNLVNKGIISWQDMVELMSVRPRQIIRTQKVQLKVGSVADLSVIDPKLEWTVSAQDFESKSANSGFIGAHLQGRATHAYVGGIAILKDGKVVA